MSVSFKRIIALIISVFIMCSLAVPVFASDDRLIIKMTVGNDTMSVNGANTKVQKPFQAENTVYVPLTAVLKAFGAELNWNGNGKINIVYRNVSYDLTIGSDSYTANQTVKVLPAAPKNVNECTMVPLQLFSENFFAITSFDAKTKDISIVQEDDGALSDLSFLTGGISKAKVGNSHFGWSMNVPKSSRVGISSFNSKDISIENEHRQIILDISVDMNEGRKLEEVYNELVEKLGGTLLDSSVNSQAALQYAEFLYTNQYSEAVLERLYISGDYIYDVILTSYSETSPQKLMDNQYYKGILDSFKLGFKGNQTDTEDLSKVKFGLAKYENYVFFDNGNKYYTWEMDLTPEWEILKNINSEDLLSTRIGSSFKEYINISFIKADETETRDMGQYREQVKEFYDFNFNPEYYSFIEKKDQEIAGSKTYSMTYRKVLNGVSYIIEENFIPVGNFIYDITIKCPEDKYEKQKATYYKMLNTLKFVTGKTTALEQDVDNLLSKNQQSRVGKDDNMTDVQSKTYGWSMKVPGYWTEDNGVDESFLLFINESAGSGVSVETIENNAQNKALPDEEKFRFLKSLNFIYNMEFTSKNLIKAKDTVVKQYVYRLENDEEEMYSDVKLYVLDSEKYSYCVLAIIPDISSSEYNMKEIEDIWQSFKVEK